MREAASRGFWVASRVPYRMATASSWCRTGPRTPTLEPDAATSAVVERIFGMAEAGRGILDITRTLNDEGIANPTGRLWSKNGVHIILRNETYTGTLVWGADAKDKAEPVRVEKAFPAIISKTRFCRVNRKLRSRAPKRSHPARVGSSYLLSGLIKCKACNRALSGQDAKSGKFSYYVCQSVMKRGSEACNAPRLNARRFEELVVGKIRENVLTESNIRKLVKLVDEEMDGVAKELHVRGWRQCYSELVSSLEAKAGDTALCGAGGSVPDTGQLRGLGMSPASLDLHEGDGRRGLRHLRQRPDRCSSLLWSGGRCTHLLKLSNGDLRTRTLSAILLERERAGGPAFAPFIA